jgi:outer membrane cobalamin receptor
MKNLLRSLTLIFALAVVTPAVAQNALTGRVVDKANGNPLAGALITNSSTGDVAVAANDGSFRVKGGTGAQSITVTYLGYHQQALTIEAGKNSLGEVTLEPDAISVADIVITAGIVTRDRQTPVAVSNVTREHIDMKLSNQEFPEILKSTPSVYATKESGGYGDSRITMRGFNSENIGVLINGVPINDMENGRVYWSNWAGLSDVTSFMQVQRGLGASKLALSSVGGTINMVTKSTDAEKGGSIYYGLGNDGLQKLTFSVSTGLSDNGWAVTIAGGRQSADGYVRGTNYLAWNYFGNLSKMFAGGRHRLSLTVFGAPQWHNQRGNPYPIEAYEKHPDGRRMNLSWGWKDGKIAGAAYGHNEYHKPHISLVHTWNINSKSMLSTSVYASFARGGGRRAFGTTPHEGTPNDGNATTSYELSVDNNNGKFYDQTLVTPEGHIDWDAAYALNADPANGGQAKVILANAVNKHNWLGLLSTYNNQISDRIKITAGFDGRYYNAFHGSKITDLLGAEYYIDNMIKSRPANTPLHVGDLVQYDETGEILWTGIFAQAEYAKENLSAFLSASGSANFYRWKNPGAPYIPKAEADNHLAGKTVSEWVNYLPWSVKTGASYKMGQHHSVFVNGGFFTRAPFFNNTFVSYTIKTNPDAKVEKVTTVEAGYQFASSVFNLTLNGYYTLWLDKGMVRTTNTGEVFNITGLDARHMGVELEASYRPSTKLTLKAMGSVGDWIWRNNVNADIFDATQNKVDSQTLYVGGTHVGNSAQITTALSAIWEPLKNLRVGADYNWFGKNFADFDAGKRNNPKDNGVESWQMPDYGVVDVQLSYRFNMGDKIRATFYGNVNNLFDTWYIADAKNGSGNDARTALVYYGFGRTWTAGLKFNF